MIVTFPHFGPLSLSMSKFFSYLGVSFVIPSLHGEDALKKGASISPEEMCVPFKIMIGNLISAYEDGADTAVMVATCGPCRLGEYGQLMVEVMNGAGYDFKWIILDAPSDIGIREFISRFRRITEGTGVGYTRLIKGVLLCIKLIKERDYLQRHVAGKAGFLQTPHEAVSLLYETDQLLENVDSFRESFDIIKRTKKRLQHLSIKQDSDPVKILVAGEIYTSVEREGNKHLEKKLMELGCSIDRHIDTTWWMFFSLKQAVLPEVLQGMFRSKKGIPYNIGGYGRETAAKIAKGKKYDGIIKIMPSGCMPEIVTKAFCDKFQEDENCKILHLIFDEMSGNAGYETRVEAFVDMLERRKDVLDGNRYRIDKHRYCSDR